MLKGINAKAPHILRREILLSPVHERPFDAALEREYLELTEAIVA